MEIRFSEEALASISAIKNYIRERFGEASGKKFVLQLFQAINRLRSFSEMFP
jgi:plasmid stabilization system protein ParE